MEILCVPWSIFYFNLALFDALMDHIFFIATDNPGKQFVFSSRAANADIGPFFFQFINS